MLLRFLRPLIALCFLVISYHSFSQPAFWGMTTEGGPTGSGVVFKVKPNGVSYTVAHTFEAEEGGSAIGAQGMVLATDGLFYGTANRGGLHDMGTLFSYDPLTHEFQKKIDFSSALGGYPFGALMQASNGKIYGTTQWEGPNGYGTFFEYDVTTHVLQVKFAWEMAASGIANASFGVTEGDDGLLYGTRYNWGSARKGLIFRYDPSSGIYEERYHFTDDNTGRSPMGVLTKLDDGTFLGVTETGGTNNNGTVYQYNPVTNTLLKKADVSGSAASGENGAYPVGFLTRHSNGKFYGVTQSGGTVVNNSSIGTLFEYDHTTGTYTLKYSFSSTTGIRPSGKLIAAGDGKLYGKTNEGGTDPDQGGTFFSFDPSGNVFNKIKDFGGAFGMKPYGSLDLEPNGKILGSTSEGGQGEGGVLFEYDIASGDLEKIRDMNVAPEGAAPLGSFVRDPSGKLLATVSAGGANGKGAIFQIDPETNAFLRIADFDGTNGTAPVGNLILADNGKYYGMTRYGGDHNSGVIFQFDYDTKQCVAVFQFDDTNGIYPGASLTIGSDGMLFGVTPRGGDNGWGTVFTLNTVNNDFTKIHDFNPATGSGAEGGMTLFTDNKLYGVTMDGGANNAGVIYRIDPATGEYDNLYDMDNSTGVQPFGNMLAMNDDKMYGITSGGGQFNGGVIFQFTPSSGEYVALKHLSAGTGTSPQGSLTAGANGMVYGMTSRDGEFGSGTLFGFKISTKVLTTIKSFNLSDGAQPTQNNLFMIRGNQQISFTAQEITYNATPLQLAGFSSSNLKLSYESSDPTIASVQDGLLTMHKTGSVSITASQEGNEEYNPAVPVQKIFTIKLSNPVAAVATEISQSGFTANWNAVEGAVSYLLDISTDNFTTFVAGYEQKSVTGLSENVTGLLPDTEYKYRVKAVGEYENSGYSDVVSVLTTLPPAAPVILDATDITTTGFTAHWEAVSTATGYELDVSADHFSTFISSYQSKPVSTLSEVLSGLTASTTYQYRVRALNGGGKSVYSAVKNVITAAVPKAAQKITFSLITDKTNGGEDFTITATSDSGLPVLFTTTSSTVQITGSKVKILSAGKTKIQATQSGNDRFLAAEPVEQSFCVLPVQPKITSSKDGSGNLILMSDAEKDNHWYFEGEVKGSEQSIKVTTSGSYTVKVLTGECSAVSESFIVQVVTAVEESDEPVITVYPNPVKDVGYILSAGNHVSRIRIIQSGGTVVWESDAYHPGQQIDFTPFTPGLYLVEITQGNKRDITRLVKN